MTISDVTRSSEENLRTIRAGRDFLDQLQVRPELYWPFLRPCEVKVLMVVDGLNFSDADFGLSTFVRTLLDMPGGYVRFRITLADVGSASATDMLDGEARIVRRITQFKFDNEDHFGPGVYDQVMLFGIATSFPGRGNDASGAPYPADRLSDTELRGLTEFMNAGGGLFATETTDPSAGSSAPLCLELAACASGRARRPRTPTTRSA